MTFNGDGSLAKAESVRLTVERGTGRYSRVESGSGVIHVAPAADNPSQLVGSLTLSLEKAHAEGLYPGVNFS